jgi:hypothetical protein
VVGEGTGVIAVTLNVLEGLSTELLAAQVECNLLLLITNLLKMLLFGAIG